MNNGRSEMQMEKCKKETEKNKVRTVKVKELIGLEANCKQKFLGAIWQHKAKVELMKMKKGWGEWSLIKMFFN